MARRKAEPSAGAREVPHVLDRLLAGQPVAPAELRAAADSAATLRRNWLKDMGEAVGYLQAGTPQYEAFKNCSHSMMDLFVQHGIITGAESQRIWLAIEERA